MRVEPAYPICDVYPVSCLPGIQSNFGSRLVFEFGILVIWVLPLMPVPIPVSMSGMEVLGSGEPIDFKHLRLCLCLYMYRCSVVGVVIYLSCGKRVVAN